MDANFVPLMRRFHAHAAMLLCLGSAVLIGAVSLRRSRVLPPASASIAAPLTLEVDELSDEEPRFDVRLHTALWRDAFDIAPAPIRGTRFGRYETLVARRPRFDRRAGLAGSGALRIDWAAADTSRAACTDDSQLLEASFAPAPEITVSYWVRYSPDFVFDWSGREHCQGNAKKLFLLWAREGSRFVFVSENGALGVGSDHDHPLFAQNRATTLSPQDLADGSWHRVTLRIRQGSSATRADGAILGWIDGVLQWRYTNVVTHNSGGYYLFKMPATFNSGSPVAQSEWLDGLEIWRTR